MKRGTDQLLKFKKLKHRLGMKTWQVKGILQALWDFAAENAIHGDVGRFSDEDIAFGIEYEGDAAELVAALVEEHWLDRDPEHRLVVHDWLDHCEDWIKKKIRRDQDKRAADNGGHTPPPPPRRPTSADTPTQPEPEPQAEPAPSDSGGQRRTSADNGGQCPPAADGGGQWQTSADSGGQRRKTSACHSHSHGHSPGHEPGPSSPPSPPPGGEAGPARGESRRNGRSRADPSPEAMTFTAHVYAQWGGSEQAVGDPSPREAAKAEPIVASVREIDPDGDPARWGREFARFIHDTVPDPEEKSRHSVPIAVARKGAAWLAHYKQQLARQADRRQVAAQHDHRERFGDAWLEYVRQVYDDLKDREPERVHKWREKATTELTFAKNREPTEEEMLERFVHDARKSGVTVLDFWDWDEELNPEGFGKEAAVK